VTINAAGRNRVNKLPIIAILLDTVESKIETALPDADGFAGHCNPATAASSGAELPKIEGT